MADVPDGQENTAPVRPLFVFSLPRAGSTLVQRVLSAAPEVASTAEPWILLPFLYARRESGIYAEYGHSTLFVAFNEFIGRLPGGEVDYAAELRRFVSRLYRRAACNGATYFLDKTPRYHFVVDEVMELFPDARFIFLWRNPLATAASMIDTWGAGRWKLYTYKADLYTGLANLVSAYQGHADRALAVRYEDLVSEPEASWRRVFDYLEIPFSESVLASFAGVDLPGSMGDPTGTRAYDAISREPLEKWKRTMANPFRRHWCNRYLEWIGDERLRVMGYDPAELRDELRSCGASGRHLASDLLRSAAGAAYSWGEPAIFRDKLRLIGHGSHVHAHR